MLICIFDTETDGLRSPVHLVEIGVILLDVDPAAPEAAVECAVVSLIVRPDGWTIPATASAIHGITHAQAEHRGVPLIVAISALTNLWAVADLRAAHNLAYDDRVIEEALSHLGRKSALARPRGVCTRDLAAPVVNLPPTEKMKASGFGGKPKSPRLAEAYRFFFDEDIMGAHSALADARASSRILIELMRRNVQI